MLLLFAPYQCALAENAISDPPSLSVETSSPDKRQFRVKIADPFIELHTGPSAGYPIFHVVERGVEVRIIRRKTRWFKLETDDGKTGWASREQMRQTLLPSGEQFKLVDLGVEDFAQRKWIVGVTGGEFDSTPVFTFFSGYSFTENLAGEVHIGQSIGRRSSSQFIKGNLVMQPVPDLRFSPYLTLGLGKIEVSPSSTLIAANDDTSTMAQFGLGLQTYISRSFLFRLEVNEYVIFSTTSTTNNNEEVEEWKFGFAVFF
jgi:hypothetical protein